MAAASLGLLGAGLGHFEYARQVDLEGRALSRLALYINVSARLFHDAVDSRESQARPLSLGFGGVEGFEDVRARLVVHPHTTIAHGEKHVLAGLGVKVLR